MPTPTFDSSDTPAFSGGERNTLGIWKDTKNMDAAKKFLEYVAGDDNMEKLSDATKEPTALQGVKSSSEYQDYFDKYADTRVFPYFDRTYIQNGMWDVMCKSGTQLLAEQITPAQFSDTMKSENDRLANK
jgi:raffinose/stachyose/melibiose transport system substrate-binding protein